MTRDEVVLQRWLLFGLALSTTAAATTRLWAIFRVDGISPLEAALLGLFAILFAWIATSFWVACLGAYALWRGAPDLPLTAPEHPLLAHGGGSRTVLVMPVYNEDTVEVFARLRAIYESLRDMGARKRFDIFVLSDSTDPSCQQAEALAWRRLHDDARDVGIFYRHRDDNTGHKSGNLAEFCVNWGALYDYMVVLDADSLMTGTTLLRLVALMDANPRSALIQVAPVLIGGETLFARMQQFASWVYGRVYAAGLAQLQGPDGNYWGHNAIIRIQPFMQHCGLPILPGKQPLGGEIMSHDFVEAALLRRAGWDVWLTTELGGSYETSPPTIIDHLKRDRRWCQGNLQHMTVLLARGLKVPSRLHMAMGVMSYVSSPLWLLMIILFSADAVSLSYQSPVIYIGRYPMLVWPVSHTIAFITIGVATAFLLYTPKFFALLLTLRDRKATRAHGGAFRLILDFILENVFATLIAPVFMLAHSWFVFNILLGRNTRWGAQARGTKGTAFRRSAAAFAPHTAIGLLAGIAAWYGTGDVFWWYVPILVGPVLSIFLSWATSKPSWGTAARRLGLFLVPSESTRLPIVDRVDKLVAEAEPAVAAPVAHNSLQTA